MGQMRLNRSGKKRLRVDNGISNMEVINNLYKVSFRRTTERVLGEGEDSVWTVTSRLFPKRREELGPLSVEEVQSRTDLEKITCSIKTHLILITKI